MDTPSHDTSRLHGLFTALRGDLSTPIVGQSALVERLLIALLAHGPLLVEGAPGPAKTTAIRALTSRVDAAFARVQFPLDLLPAAPIRSASCRVRVCMFYYIHVAYV